MTKWSTILKISDVATRGIEEDKKQNYAAAVKLYEQCEKYLIYAIKHEARSAKNKDTLCEKLEKYQIRIKRLKYKLSKKKLSHVRSKSRLRFRSKPQRPRDQNSSRISLCDYSQLNNRLQTLNLSHDTEKKNCE